MRAIVIAKPGGAEVLELRELPDPEPPFGHVRVAVRFAGINRADVLQRMGYYPAPPGAPKDIPGLEYSGVVDALGPGANKFAIGDRVFGLVSGGAYADQLVAHEREVVKIPENVDDKEAAAIPEAFVTAFDALVVRGRLGGGDVALIHAAGSGVGTAGIQIASKLGAIVVGTSRTREKLERCKELGLMHGIVPEKGAFADALTKATKGRGADVVLDLVGGPYVEEGLRALAERGRIVVVGLTAGTRAELDLGLLMRRRAEIIGTMLRSRPLEEKIEAAKLLGDRIGPLFAIGALRAVVDEVFPLAKAGAAQEKMTGNDSFGKILLSCSEAG